MLQFSNILKTLCLLLLPAMAAGQLPKGFKALREGDLAQARAAFEAARYQPDDSTAAKFGLASCSLKQPASVGALARGFELLRSSEQDYQKMNLKARSKAGEYGLSLSAFDNLAKEFQEQGVRMAEQNKSILQLDTVMERMKPTHPKVQKHLQTARRTLANHAAKNRGDYRTLSSLIKKHHHLIASASYKDGLSVRNKLLPSFLREFGIQQLPAFVSDHPDSWVAIDCWIKEFMAEVSPDISVPGLLRFLIRYPNSMMVSWADYLLSRNTMQGAMVRDELSPEEKKRLELLVVGWELDVLVQDDLAVFGEEDQKNLFSYLKETAPSWRAYELMQQSLQKNLNTRQWDMADALLAYAQPLFPDGQPKDCKANFREYRSKQSWFRAVTPIVNREAEGLLRKPVEEVNTPAGDEFAPIPAADGRTLYFCAKNRPGEKLGGEDIYHSKFNFKTKTWGPPQLERNLSSEKDESPVAVSFDGNQMIVFREGKLHVSDMTARGWSKPVKLPGAINDFAWIGKASYSSGGDVLIFEATETPADEEQGSNIDLYLTRKGKNGQWTPPVALGVDVNTFEDERSPYLYPDDETLYFSSKGRDGLGGLDIFVSKRLDDTWMNWSVPKNLGKEINSLEDDWGYTLSMNPQNWEVYTSTDNLVKGSGDIYLTGLPSFARPKKVIPFSGKVDKTDPAPVEVVLTNPETGEAIDTVTTRPDGSFTLPISAGLPRVNYHIKGKDLFPQSKSIDLRKTIENPAFTDTVAVVTVEEMATKGIPATLDNINFDYDKYELKPASFPELERIYTLFKTQTWRIEISGHTDNVGSAEYNKGLSLRRAEAVKEYLILKGLAAERLEAKGYGAEKPVRDNQTEAGRAQNRRVEIRIVR